MATKTIAWNNGSGNIVLDFTGQGSGTITVTSDANDLTTSRSQQIVIKTMDNGIRRTVTVSQAAKPDYVDLGLPSGLLWATCNLGATNPEDIGQYFSWGNVSGHTVGDGYSFDSTTYANTGGGGLSDDIPENATYDAARSIKGGTWRLPTQDEMQELIDNCTFAWQSDYNGTGVAGALFTRNGQSLFLPVGGYIQETTKKASGTCYYWSSKKGTGDKARRMFANSSTIPTMQNGTRAYGHLLRPVKSGT